MKKLALFLACLAIVFAASGCGQATKSVAESQPTSPVITLTPRRCGGYRKVIITVY